MSGQEWVVQKLSRSGATAQLSTVTGAFQIQVVRYTHDSSQSELSMAFMVVEVLRKRFCNTYCFGFAPLLILLIPLSVMKKSMIVSIFIFLFFSIRNIIFVTVKFTSDGNFNLIRLKFPSEVIWSGENERQSSEILHDIAPIALRP